MLFGFTVGATNVQVDNNMREQQIIIDAKALNHNKLDINKVFQPSWAPLIDEQMLVQHLIYVYKRKDKDNKKVKNICQPPRLYPWLPMLRIAPQGELLNEHRCWL